MTIVRSQLSDVLGFEPTSEQWDVIDAPMIPAVVVAGAGSGKTTSMAARVAWLVGSGLAQPADVLGLTFTTKAAAQLLSTMRGMLSALDARGLMPPSEDADQPPGEPTVLTYHAFAASVVAEHGVRLGREPGAPLLSDALRFQLAYRVACRSHLPLASLRTSPAQAMKFMLELDSQLGELDIEPEALRAWDRALVERLSANGDQQGTGRRMIETSEARQVLAALVDEWRAAKADRDVLDFGDQIRLAAQIVRQYPDVVADLRSRHQVVFLDEYQDTSIAQRRLLQVVFGDGHPLIAVGDPCQAIYGWRGASVDNIDRFLEHFPASGEPALKAAARRLPLSQNRRSGFTILDVANRTSEELRALHQGVLPLTAGSNGKGRGSVACALLDTYSAEVDWLVAEIERTHEGGAQWKDIAVLAARGDDVVAVDEALRRRHIPTQTVGAAALLSQPVVAELRAMLQVLHDPTANPAFVRLAAGPRWRLGARDLAALGERAARIAGGRGRSDNVDLAASLDDAVAGSDLVETVSLSEALDDLGDLSAYSPEAVERFALIRDEMHELRAHIAEPVPDFVLRVLRQSGLEVEANLAAPETAQRQRQSLAAFLDLAGEGSDLDGRTTLGAFLLRLADAERFDAELPLDMSDVVDAVQLLTIHKAKGLEFDYVFVPFVTTAFPSGAGRPDWPSRPFAVPWPLRDDRTAELDAFPGNDRPTAAQAAAYRETLQSVDELETRRLAYVAFTRPSLGLAVSGHWWGPTQGRRRGPHPFLVAIRHACEEGAGEVVHWAPEPEEDATNPEVERSNSPREWPIPISLERRTELARAAHEVSDARAVQPVLSGIGLPEAKGLTADEQRCIEDWDLLTAALIEEARARQVVERVVRLPDTVSASTMLRATKNPGAVAEDLARPMPRPAAPSARRGTGFHAWVETRFGQQSLIDPDDLPGAADEGIVSDAELDALKAAFETNPYASRTPVAVERAFSLMVGGRVVNGRIDAVFENAAGSGLPRYDVVDWKTGSAASADPMQLALYRVAWAQLAGVPIGEVDAAFVMIDSGAVIRPETDPLIDSVSL